MPAISDWMGVDRRQLPEDVFVLEGRCVSYGSHIPYLPVLDILHAVCQIGEFAPPEHIDAKVLAALERLGPEAVGAANPIRPIRSGYPARTRPGPAP